MLTSQHLCITELGRLGLPLAAVSGLLQRAQSQHGLLQGNYIAPGTVLRCDGGHRGNIKESATFMSVPYLKPDKLVVFNERMLRDKPSHPSRPLHQALSTFGGHSQQDREQMFLKYDGRREKKVIWVNHVWIMLVGSGMWQDAILHELKVADNGFLSLPDVRRCQRG